MLEIKTLRGLVVTRKLAGGIRPHTSFECAVSFQQCCNHGYYQWRIEKFRRERGGRQVHQPGFYVSQTHIINYTCIIQGKAIYWQNILRPLGGGRPAPLNLPLDTRQYQDTIIMTRVLLLPFISTVWTRVVFAIINII